MANLIAMNWKLGHPDHGNLSHKSARCDMQAIQHRAAFVPYSLHHLHITCRDYMPQMIMKAETVDIYTVKYHHTLKKTNIVTKLLRLWLRLHITQQYVCSKAHQASSSYCLCWSGPPAGLSVVAPAPPSTSYPTTLYQTEPNKTQANIM